MRILGVLHDPQSILSPNEFAQIEKFIIDKCYCTITELDWLWRIVLRDDGPRGYRGYWAVQYLQVGARIESARAIIVLNSFYLFTVEQILKTLAHEYGHHWTLMYMLDRLNRPFQDPAPPLYYRIRGLTPGDFAPDYSRGWDRCDKEVLAEDYKYHFSPYKGKHRMENFIGNPTGEVRDYIWSLGKPHFI